MPKGTMSKTCDPGGSMSIYSTIGSNAAAAAAAAAGIGEKVILSACEVHGRSAAQEEVQPFAAQ